MLPNFLHIGAAKAASSWLWNVCKGHPEIYVPESPDNVNFFTVGYHRGLGWYEDTYFADVAEESAVGEFSNSYMCYRPALERIARHLPDVKLTMTLRDPVESMYLSWAHTHLKDKEYGFNGEKDVGIPLDKCLHHHGHAWFRLYVDPRMYGRHLSNIYELFPRENVFVMLYSDLQADEAGFLKPFYDFLDVDTSYESDLVGQDINPDSARVNMERDLDADFRAELREVFRPDVEQLEEMIDRDLSEWLKA